MPMPLYTVFCTVSVAVIQ